MTKAQLGERRLRGEWMDEPDLDARLHATALRGLARINFWSRTAASLEAPLRDLTRRGGAPLRVLDLATGGGDVPRALARRLRGAGLDVEFAGCDRSAAAVDYARRCAAAAGDAVQFFVLDALQDDLPRDFDVIACSLFLHHLATADAASLLARMARAARRMVLVSDLRRSAWGLALARWGTCLLSRSPVVRADGPRSVEASFTLAEVAALAERAGLAGATLRRSWPQRYVLQWIRG